MKMTGNRSDEDVADETGSTGLMRFLVVKI